MPTIHVNSGSRSLDGVEAGSDWRVVASALAFASCHRFKVSQVVAERWTSMRVFVWQPHQLSNAELFLRAHQSPHHPLLLSRSVIVPISAGAIFHSSTDCVAQVANLASELTVT